MSDENVPKLRLKPKLGAEPVVASPASATPVEPVAPAAPTADSEAPKLIRLKPKLTAAPAQEATPTPAPAPEPPPPAEAVPPAPAPAAEPARLKPRLSAAPMKEATRPPMPMAAPAPAPEAAPAPAPAAETPKPAFKLGLKPKAAAAAQPGAPSAGSVGPMPPPPGTEGHAPVLDAPPPPPSGATEIDTGENGEPAEITIMRKASSAPFTSPSKFPPPPGLKKSIPGGPTEPGLPVPKARLGKKKLILMAGGGVAALVLLGGGFVVYQSLTAEPPPPPKLVANPTTPQGQAVAKATDVVDQVNAQAEVPVEETPASPVEATPADSKPAEPVVVADTEPKPVEEVKPAAPPLPPPPPPASIAFRGWVENLKISGVRGGANPRVFVGKSSYQSGDLVNPQLGITFEGYNSETRILTFKDKTGAKVERRN